MIAGWHGRSLPAAVGRPGHAARHRCLMELITPWALAGLVLVPAIFLWGLLAPRGRPLVVGSLMLWRRALGTGPVGKPSASVRLKDPLLWLDAATVLLIVLACAQPAVKSSAPAEPVATFVVDRTAGMLQEKRSGGTVHASVVDRTGRMLQVTGPGRASRSELAQVMADEVLDALGDAPIRIVFVPDKAGAVAIETATARRLESSDAWVPVFADTDVWPIAVAESARHSNLPVVVATGVAPTVQLPANVYVLAPGGRSANVGLTRLASRVEGDRWWLLVAARADLGATGPWTLVVGNGGRILARKPDFLAAGTTAQTVLAMSGPPPRSLTVMLGGRDEKQAPPPDTFMWDNAAEMALEPARKIQVLLVGRPDMALRRALAARDDIVVVDAPPQGAVPIGGTDLVMACAATIPADWKGPSVSLLPPEPVGPVRPVSGQGAADWRVAPDNPLAGALYLEPPRIGAIGRYILAEPGRLLLGTRDMPLMVTWEAGGSRHLAVLFGLDEATTDWPRRPGFPVFWSRAMDWLVPKDGRPANLETHRPFEVLPGRDHPAPGLPGLYEDKSGSFAVSFIGSEAAFKSGPGRDDSADAIEAIRKSIEAKRRAGLAPLWPYLALAALAALLARSCVAS